MNFQYPYFLFLLIFLFILLIWYYKIGKNKEATLKISSSQFISQKMKLLGHVKYMSLQVPLYVIIFLSIIALARPRIIDNFKENSVKVIDILLVIDISSSMLADDFNPNRLEAVKLTASEFINKRSNDRIGILVFAGESFIQCPLTTDTSVLLSLINSIEIASKEYDGTAIGMAIANGTNRLRNSDVNSKVMVLLSDGTNNSGEIDPKTAAKLASEFGIKIYTIGAGTNQSYTQIPGRGMFANEIDEQTLQFIAKETNAKYFRATDINGLTSIYNEIDELERSVVEVKEFIQYKELYSFFLIPAFILGLVREIFRLVIFRTKF